MIENIKMLVMDVDGTLTDGKIYYGNDGELFKAFDVRDGYRLVKCEEYGIITAIITGKTSKIVEGRARDLKIKEVHQGVSNKIEVLKTLIEKYNVDKSQVAYIGDDVNDIECMQYCGFSACPADAIDEVKNTVDYVRNRAADIKRQSTKKRKQKPPEGNGNKTFPCKNNIVFRLFYSKHHRRQKRKPNAVNKRHNVVVIPEAKAEKNR